ncbi:recombinase family protein [Halomonas sp. MCCC 1A11062]|uniref:recombinase family protein n=1 Tax=Halomonas sp. MCCC 1A11062 TaxID=2733485 RepID=UPI001F2F1ECA|nr:recombinase family protein [Halomonas sp. MCCC 1A11062]MCE8036448.1 recombinase family protein [Halomonas sp. MCCC 1A11062]
MTKAIAYVRYSSAIQSKGDSIERQRSPLEAFESRFNVKVDEIYTDEGISSYRGDNIKKGRFSEILEKIDNQEIKPGDFLVIESIDRISRQELNKTAKILQDILEKGIKIYTTIDEKLYNYEDKERDLENYLMIGLIAKRANEESETKSKRRRSAWNKTKKLAEKGEVFNTKQNTPYGLEVVDGKFRIIEEEAKEIRFIIQNLKYEGASQSIRKVNEWSKRKWQSKHIAHFMKNQYIRGAYRAQRRVDGKKVHERYIENYYPKIVSDSDFYEAKKAMESRRVKVEYGNKSVGNLNIFKHCIKCAKCGSTMIFMKNRNPRGVWYSYYQCETRKEKKAGCEGQFLRAEYVVSMFLAELELRLEYKKDINEKDKLIYEIMRPKEKPEDLEAFNEKKEELSKNISILSNLEKTADELEGKAPTYLFKKMAMIEEEIERFKADINKMDFQKKERLNIYSFNELLDMVYTENGRLRINKFLKDAGVKLYVNHIKKHRAVELSIYINDEQYSFEIGRFKLRGNETLEKYKLTNLADYMEY